LFCLVSIPLSGEIFLNFLSNFCSFSSGALAATGLFKVATSLPDVMAIDVVRAIGDVMDIEDVRPIGVVKDICVVSAIGVVMAAGAVRAIDVVSAIDVELGLD
jgi:hypothetical protein